MNLYLISQNERNDWDTYDGAVVCANDENEARNMDPQEKLDGFRVMDWTDTTRYDWCSSPDKVKVVLIGTAADGSKPGVVLSSFRAG